MTAGEQVESRPTILVVTPHGAAAKQTSGTNFVLDLFSLRDVVEDKRKQGIRLVGFIDDVAILGRTDDILCTYRYSKHSPNRRSPFYFFIFSQHVVDQNSPCIPLLPLSPASQRAAARLPSSERPDLFSICHWVPLRLQLGLW